MEKRVVGLGMQVKILLDRVAVGAVVGEVADLALAGSGSAEGWPGRKLPGQGVVHRPDIGDGELGEWLL